MTIYDGFTFFNELDLLKIRLAELTPVVDKFVLVEATQTFQGGVKPLHYANNKHLFADYANKIIHVIVEFPASISNLFSKKSAAWAREYYQRDQILGGIPAIDENDLIMVSDVDEIVSAEKFCEALRVRKHDDLIIFTMPLYMGSLNRRHHHPKWTFGPRLVRVGKHCSAQKIRMTKLVASKKLRGSRLSKLHTRAWNAYNCGFHSNIIEIDNAGWHFSSIGSWHTYRNKIESYSHEEGKQQTGYQDEQAFFQYLDDTTIVVDASELPAFVQNNMHSFKHLIS